MFLSECGELHARGGVINKLINAIEKSVHLLDERIFVFLWEVNFNHVNRILFFILFVSFRPVCLLAQPGINDMTFNPNDSGFGRGDGPISNVTAMVILPDEKTIIAGEFTTYNSIEANRIARIHVNGLYDSTFNVGTGANSGISSMVLQADGKIIIGGSFTSFNGTPVNRIARLNPNGSLDNTFNTGAGVDGDINGIILQPNGQIIVKGLFGIFNGVPVDQMIRLNSNGSLDNTFDLYENILGGVAVMAIQSNGKIIVGGFLNNNGPDPIRILRLNTDGSLDNTFATGTGPNSTVTTISIQPNGQILVGGYFTEFNGSQVNQITRLNADGSVDNGFHSELVLDENAMIFSNAIQADGKILIGGVFVSQNVSSIKSIARLNNDGTIDGTFNAGCGDYDQTKLILPRSNGKIIIHGQYLEFNVSNYLALTQLESSGQRDFTFNKSSGANSIIFALGRQSDGKIVIGGDFNTYNNVITNRIARLTADGILDSTFNMGIGFKGLPFFSRVYSIVIQPDDKILVGGSFISYNGMTANKLVRLNSDGSIDSSFNFTADYDIYAISLQSDGKIVIGGLFMECNNTSMNMIARLNPDGSLDNTFNIGSGFDNAVSTLAIQSDGKILVGGSFYSYNGSVANRMARLNPDGSLDNTFTVPLEFQINWEYGIVEKIKLQTDGKILVGGGIHYYWNGGVKRGIARLLPNGHIDNTFDVGTGTDLGINAIAVQENGSILIGGGFTTFNGTTGKGVVKLNSDGSLNPSFSISGANSRVHDLDVLPNGKILMVGYFTAFNGVGRNRITRVYDCYPTTSSETIISCENYTWPVNGQSYSASGVYTAYLVNSTNCDSIITLNLTIIQPLPPTITNSFSMPSDANSCAGEVAIDLSGNADFELDFDSGSQIITSNGYSLVTGLCAGIHDLHVTDNCGDTLSTTIVIPVDSNYIFNNPFIDSLAQDSLGVTMTNCDIYYAGIDTAYIDSIWATGNIVNVIWNIVDSNGSNLDTTTYVLNNGNGVYWLQLSVFCPFKSVGEYFTVSEAIYFNNGSVSTAGLGDIGENLFEIYPNPTNDQVHISFSGSDADLTVYDVQGKMVLKDRIQNQEIISLQNFERGVYLFDFNNSQGHSVQRVVKQ